MQYSEVTIAQSHTIERFLARRFGLLGENELDAALIDGVCEHVKTRKNDFNILRVCVCVCIIVPLYFPKNLYSVKKKKKQTNKQKRFSFFFFFCSILFLFAAQRCCR